MRRSFHESTRERPRPRTVALIDGFGSPRASRIRVIGTRPSPVIVHTPAAGLFTRTIVVPSSRSSARNLLVCTSGASGDTLAVSPAGPTTMTPGPGTVPSPLTSHATLRRPFGTVKRRTFSGARSRRVGLTSLKGVRSQPVNASGSNGLHLVPAPTWYPKTPTQPPTPLLDNTSFASPQGSGPHTDRQASTEPS